MTTFDDIARVFGGQSLDTKITGVSSFGNPQENTLSFTSVWTESALLIVRDNPNTLFLIPEGSACDLPNSIAVSNPRLRYAEVLRGVMDNSREAVIADTAVTSGAVLGENVSVGHFSVISEDVLVGDNCEIGSHVVLHRGSRIGANSTIGDHTVVGGQGFGFERDDDGQPIRIDHRGGVDIGQHVEIGSHVVIARGTIEDTRVSDHVKIDDCVFIAHNVEIGEGAFVIAGAEICGSAKIGKRAWISPGVSVTNKAKIGDDALIGIGSVVIRDIGDGVVAVGSPAKPLENRGR